MFLMLNYGLMLETIIKNELLLCYFIQKILFYFIYSSCNYVNVSQYSQMLLLTVAQIVLSLGFGKTNKYCDQEAYVIKTCAVTIAPAKRDIKV